MFREQRVDPRERLALPIKLGDGLDAVTRDVSAAGIFFVIEGHHALRGAVDFELQLPEFALRFTSAGEIVRLERGEDTTGVAVRFVDPHLEVLDGSDDSS